MVLAASCGSGGTQATDADGKELDPEVVTSTTGRRPKEPTTTPGTGWAAESQQQPPTTSTTTAPLPEAEAWFDDVGESEPVYRETYVDSGLTTPVTGPPPEADDSFGDGRADCERNDFTGDFSCDGDAGSIHCEPSGMHGDYSCDGPGGPSECQATGGGAFSCRGSSYGDSTECTPSEFSSDYDCE